MLVSSPSDVSEERDSLSRVIETVNLALEAGGKSIRLQLRKWETDVPPGLHKQGGQGQIESKLHFGDCDVLIGIFWKRFGTPVQGSSSGTEREILQGREGWRSKNRPKVMVFFNTAAHHTRTLEEVEQLRKVIEFKESLKPDGLVREYSDLRDFEAMVTRYLLMECLGSNEAERLLRSPILCRVVSSPVEVRAEGRVEHVSDLRLFLWVDYPTVIATARQSIDAAPLLVDVDVHLNTTIVWHAGGTGPILVLGGLGPTTQHEGRRIAPNCIRFEDVPVKHAYEATTVTIANIRADALRLAIAGAGAFQEIFAVVTARDGFRDVTIKNEKVMLAFIHPGNSLGFDSDLDWPAKLPRARISGRLEGGSEAVSPTLTLRIWEQFPGAFKTRAEEAGITVLPTDRVANSGTRLMLALQAIPDGIDVYVAAYDHREGTGNPGLQLIQTRPDTLRSPNEPSPLLMSSHGVGLVQIDVTERNAVAVWEWVSADPILLHSVREVRVDILLAAPIGAVVDTGTVAATVMLAPQSYEKEADSLPVPCFGTYHAFMNLLSIE